MKVKQSILDKINNLPSRMNIATDLGCGEQAIAVQIRRNKSDGRLTKMDALIAISKQAGVPVDKILEKEKAIA